MNIHVRSMELDQNGFYCSEISDRWFLFAWPKKYEFPSEQSSSTVVFYYVNSN